MRINLLWLDVKDMVLTYTRNDTLFVRPVKALTRLRFCAVSSESSLAAYAICAKMARVGAVISRT